MFRFKSISVFGSSFSEAKEFDPLSTLDDSYSVDDSHFAPESEVFKRLQGNMLGLPVPGDQVSLYYDFADGSKIPSDFRLPFVRGSGYKDIAELSSYINNLAPEASENYKKDLKKAQDTANMQKIVDEAAKRFSSSSESSKE